MTKNERILLPEDYREAIGQAIGAASMCWTPRPSDAVFDSECASAIADELIARFAHMAEALDRVTEALDRLHRAESALLTLASEAPTSSEWSRLESKRQGVRLALDYLRGVA